jgi:hypothetical protein
MFQVFGEKHYKYNPNYELMNPYLQHTDISYETDSTAHAKCPPGHCPVAHEECGVCGVAPVSFYKLVKYIEYLDNSDENSTSNAMFASELLSYYRPKGRLALISPFLHVSLIMACCIPTLALFTLWALNQFSYYYFTITQTTAFGFLIICFYL